MKAAREVWHESLADVSVDRLVFIDESGATTDMQRRRGRSPKGTRCVSHAPAGHWKVLTMIGAVRLDGPLCCATMLGAVDTISFVAWVHACLCPSLRVGDVVVMDNLSVHKAPAVREAIESIGAQLIYLPPYSPDFNPLEPMWSKVKECLRSAASRTIESLTQTVEMALTTVSASDCRGYFSHCGYAM